MHVLKNLALSIGLSVIAIPAISQFKGDDDGVLSQKAAERDKAAINAAVNGWWTASMKNHDQRIAWWREARFGCFIHWGVYSVPGGLWKGKKVGGYAEHLMRKEKISRGEYDSLLIRTFNPVDFDAEAWVKQIKAAGMRYVIITAKHHDGVAMYPTNIGDYSIKNSAFKRDPMAELVAACHKNGLKFGFYYSHAFDWEHPDAPGNDWDYDNPGGDKDLHGGRNWYDVHPELLPKAVKYVNEKSIPQIKELIAKYHPDILWFDTPHKLPLSENIRILQAIRSVDNNVVVNGRLARSSDYSFGDYINTSDRPAEFYPVHDDWEAIPTTNESYGYSRYDESHKPVSFFIRLLAKAADRGGNLLMNIGPEGNGVIDPRDTIILHGIGEWMQRYGNSIYGTKASPLPIQPWGEVTTKDNRLFLHVFSWPANKTLTVGGLQGKVKKAWLMNTKTALKTTVVNNGTDVNISLPATAPDSINSVVVVEMEQIKPTEATVSRLLDGTGVTNRLLAYDAQYRKGLTKGDGKIAGYYVADIANPADQLTWKVRVAKAGTYNVSVKYFSSKPDAKFDVKAGAHSLQGRTNQKKGIVTEKLGVLELAAGENVIVLAPASANNEEIMKVFELQLDAANK
ncbi:Alpha-L-fucosidase [Chitinophaga jiangningensis]|uniref:alpha-L-fucosidase n=1 Tax=Chitinophaga jiangningensis TaxID=1419482 RepID=A0A1M7FDV2_9BACT|nr:alpha-L-fucosidase [Chitinophaga jiangningensis]SHM01869.1 Alpha-L-fucosidase [Chitinophaga jiangningensis]